MPERKTRNVSLTPELENLIDQRVAQGRFRSASEVVRAALRQLEELDTPPRRTQPAVTRSADADTAPAERIAHLQDRPGFLAGGGEMGALTRAHDWAATPLGSPETWSQ